MLESERIYKYISMIGRDVCAEDSIERPTYNVKSYCLDYDLVRKCLSEKCPLVPVCLSGCSFEALLKYGDKNKIYCRRDLYTLINSEILKRVYKNDQI